MRWWGNFLIYRAADSYARRLPAILNKNWGASETYTPGQIDVAVATARLNPRYVALAYAAFLPEEAYAVLKANLPLPLTYGGARATLRRRIRRLGVVGSWENAASDGNVFFGDWSSWDVKVEAGGHGGGDGGGHH